jgi:hypothetical protein
MLPSAKEHALATLRHAVGLAYHLLLLAAVSVACIALLAKHALRQLPERSKTRALATKADTPQRVMHVHVHLNMQGEDHVAD